MDKTVFNSPVFIYTLFTICIIIALAPVLSFHYFPTVDGPAHLYNAKIIRELWWGDKDLYSPFFKFNNELVPNWTGHFIAVLAGVILPAWMVEKLIILLIVIGTLTGINSLSHSFGALVSWQLLLVLPLIYTVTLYLGFFNFMFSVVLLLFLLSWMVKWDPQMPVLFFVRVFICTTLLYFSHVLAFGVAILFVGLLIVWERFNDGKAIFSRGNILKMICFIPGILLALLFFSTRKVEGFRNKTEQVPSDELIRLLVEGAPMIGLNEPLEVPYTSFYMKGISLLIALTFIIRIRTREGFAKADLLLLFALLMLICYFVIPDGMAAGGFISVRLLLLVLIFTVAWLLCFKMPLWISLLAGLMGVIVSFSTLPYRMQATRQLDLDARNMIELAALMKPGKVVLPLNYSVNWLHLNLPGYIGAATDLILLENYEADFNEFPLQWKRGVRPGPLIDDFKNIPIQTQSIEIYERVNNLKIDYVIRWRFNMDSNDSTTQSIDRFPENRYRYIKRVGQGDVLSEIQ